MTRLPPHFNRRVLLGAPRRLREDLVQEAWLAYMEGRSPTTAARNFVAKEMLHSEREHAAGLLDWVEDEE